MKYSIYLSLSVLLLLQGCGGESDTKTPSEQTQSEETQSEQTPSEENSNNNSAINLPIDGIFSEVSTNIVKEEQSNLYWQDNVEAKESVKKFAEAEGYCSSLILDGIASWRLPTYKELHTLVNYNREKPAIDDVFQYADSKQYWTSTKLDANKDFRMWTIDFSRGQVHSAEGIYLPDFNIKHHVRCVSDEFAIKRSSDVNFIKNGDIVSDNIHNLLWQDALEVKTVKRSFIESESYCNNLSLNGLNTGWRVPTVKELSSLVNLSTHNAAIYNTFTRTAYNDAYWTANEQINSGIFRWSIEFKDGVITRGGTNSKAFDKYVRCVRNK